MRVLIVEDDAGSVIYLRDAVAAEGHEVAVETDGLAGLDAFHRATPDLVFCDIRIPRMDGLELLGAIREHDADTIVVMITAYGSEEYAAEALRRRASNYLHKPIRHADLLSMLRKYAFMTEELSLAREVPAMIVQQAFTLRFDNREEVIPAVAAYLTENAGDMFDRQTQLDVRLGLHELLINAVEHGNLGITDREKAEALESGPDGLIALWEKRLTDPQRTDKRVTVEFKRDQTGCEWLIADCGDGFNWQSAPDLPNHGNRHGLQGRGLIVARFYFDQLEHQGAGNVVRARKDASRHAGSTP